MGGCFCRGLSNWILVWEGFCLRVWWREDRGFGWRETEPLYVGNWVSPCWKLVSNVECLI